MTRTVRTVFALLFALSALTAAGCDDSSGGSPDETTADTSPPDEDTRTDIGDEDTAGDDTTDDDTGGDDTTDDDTSTGDVESDTGGEDTAGDTHDPDTTHHGMLTGIEVRPATVTIEVVNGVATPRDFAAFGIYEDGFETEVGAGWQFDRFELAGIDADGLLTANGSQGGVGTVTALFAGQEATASVRIELRENLDLAGLTPADQAAFATPDAEPSGTLLYPYDGTMFARGIQAPEIQWDGGAAGDQYLALVEQDFMTVEAWFVADPPASFTLPPETWTKLTQSNTGEPVQVRIMRRTPGGSAHQAMTQQWNIAQGSLKGTIYYWAVNEGRIMKITPGSAAPAPIFDAGDATQLGTPAPSGYDNTMPPWTAGAEGKRCVSCHTVSRNGNAIAAVFENKSASPSPWGLIDLTASPEPQLTAISDYLDNTIWVALNPDASWAVSNKVDFRMQLVDNTTGAVTPSALDSFTDAVADPSFSGDGTMLAFSSNVTGAYPVEYWRADLDVMDFDAASGTLSNRRTVVDAGSEVIAFPSFSPTSEWIFYQRGDYSRAKYGADQVGHDRLYMADVAGATGQIALDNLNGLPYLPAVMHDLNYEPRVNPIAVGGYAWVVFMTPRDYGHRMRAPGGNPTYENRKQLWVAAVDLNPTPGEDPSHPAFWLPGQDLSTTNMSGYWALDPCRADGEGCEAGFECCSGFCQDDGSGQSVCVPPTGECSQEGEACAESGDCCVDPAYPLSCIGGFCAFQPN